MQFNKKGILCSFKGESVQFNKTKIWFSFIGKLVRFKRGLGAVLKGNRRSLSTPVNASKSGPGFYCAPKKGSGNLVF